MVAKLVTRILLFVVVLLALCSTRGPAPDAKQPHTINLEQPIRQGSPGVSPACRHLKPEAVNPGV